MSKEEYITMVKSWGRDGMLRIARASGFTAHKLSDDDIANLLWERIGKLKYMQARSQLSDREIERIVRAEFISHAEPLASKRNFYNASLDILVKFTGEEFVIIGDEEMVSDAVLSALHEGRLPSGWSVAP